MHDAFAGTIVSLVRDALDPDRPTTIADAVLGADPGTLSDFFHATFATEGGSVLTRGTPASPGAASGRVVLDADAAIAAATHGDAVILLRRETGPDDIVGMRAAAGLLTTRGGRASHAAVVARGWGIPAVVGASTIDIDAHGFAVDGAYYPEGTEVAIDGGTGEVTLGARSVVGVPRPPEVDTLLDWADTLAAPHVLVRANADSADDARLARAFGARGIGLCRTEHMFFAADRVPLMRAYVLAEDGSRSADEALAALTELQVDDFVELLGVFASAPVTIRLLDAPLHEFLPDRAARVRDEALGVLDSNSRTELAAIRRLTEANPMLGTRGVRLAVLQPALYQAQVRAIGRAVATVRRGGGDPHVDILVPLVVDATEMRLACRWISDALRDAGCAPGDHVRVGAMIETPRAALTVGEIAATVDFVSFGTNDLTQLTLGLSRDDVEAVLIPRYLDLGLFDASPFSVLDDAVGSLVRSATDEARVVNPAISIGVCGEHAGDPISIERFVASRVDSLSCSPYRVPVARLAAAQAVLRQGLCPEPAAIDATGESREPGMSGISGMSGMSAAPGDDDRFAVIHALRVKGFAALAAVAWFADLDPDSVAAALGDLHEQGLARHVAKLDAWQLTVDGRSHHAALIPHHAESHAQPLRAIYPAFLDLNGAFKELCVAWQLRDGAPNDHTDHEYDQRCVTDLAAIDAEAGRVLLDAAESFARLARHRSRLADAIDAIRNGATNRFTGVQCDSYHDAWMELHEDLIQLLQIDRAAEGSY